MIVDPFNVPGSVESKVREHISGAHVVGAMKVYSFWSNLGIRNVGQTGKMSQVKYYRD